MLRSVGSSRFGVGALLLGVLALGLMAIAVVGEPVGRWRFDIGAMFVGLASLATAFVGWKRLQVAAAELSAVNAVMFGEHPQPMLTIDEDSMRIVAANEAATRLYGRDVAASGKVSWLELHRPADRTAARERWVQRKVLDSGATYQAHHQKLDGTQVPVEIRWAPTRFRNGRGRVLLIADVTERNQVLSDMRTSESRYHQLFDTAIEGIMTVDTDMTISTANQHAATMLAYSIDDLVGRSITDVSHEGVIHLTVDSPDGRETTLIDSAGAGVRVLVSESTLVDGDGQYAGQLGMFTDLTERNRLENEIEHQATHDPLTGLPNRLLLADELQRVLNETTFPQLRVAAVCLDISDFKKVNSEFGHSAGDRLLCQVASRLSAHTPNGGLVARLGGNEFVIIIQGAADFAQAFAARIRAVVATAWELGDSRSQIATSIGVAIGDHGDRPGLLLRNAELALSHAKAGDVNCTEFYTPSLRASSTRRTTLEDDLRHAIQRDQFFLDYQPVVSLIDQRIIGAEALIRWEHPERGTVGPKDFISVAEEIGLIGQLGTWVIEHACAQLGHWQRTTPEMSMAVNVSATQLRDGDLLDTVHRAVATSGVDPAHLTLEITEGVLMDDIEQTIATLTALRNAGIAISIDDFGTGYSSLAYLRNFPIDILKIDQSFVAELPDDRYATALVAAVLKIAESLALTVIAEGVETSQQASTLLQLGCDKAQGYYFHRPLSARQFSALL